MIIAIDVHYKGETAKVVGVLYESWDAEEASQFIDAYLPVASDYEPGQFYKRELPCLLHLLENVELTKVDYIVIDGYVFLDAQGRKGLGAHLYEALEEQVPVIGVAKTTFHQCEQFSQSVFRGDSTRPLYVTSVGSDAELAAGYIKEMHGPYRVPTLLQQLDTKTKED